MVSRTEINRLRGLSQKEMVSELDDKATDLISRHATSLEFEMFASAVRYIDGDCYQYKVVSRLLIESLLAHATSERELLYIIHIAKLTIPIVEAGGSSSRGIEKKSIKEEEMESCPYIPYFAATFCEFVKALQNKFELESFLDVGAGYGDKVALASLLGFNESSGVEYNRHTFEVSRFLCRKSYIGVSSDEDRAVFNTQDGKLLRFYKDDALEFDYSGYDLIYIYSPIMSKGNMTVLYNRVLDQMDIGSVLLDVGSATCWLCDDNGRFAGFKALGFNEHTIGGLFALTRASKNDYIFQDFGLWGDVVDRARKRRKS